MIPPFSLSEWGLMTNKSRGDDSLKGRCLCGCHTKGVRPDAAKGNHWCEPCLAERNQPWTRWIESIL